MLKSHAEGAAAKRQPRRIRKYPMTTNHITAASSARLPEIISRVLLVCLIALVCGCASLRTESPQPPDDDVTEETAPPVEVAPAQRPPPPVRVDPQPPVTTVRVVDTVAIVLSDRTQAFESVANAISQQHDDYLLYNLSDKSLDAQGVFSSIEKSGAQVVIAIGLQAAREAINRSTVPVVFCQVFNLGTTNRARVDVKGVSSTPPLSMQVMAWKEQNPELRTIGAILGDGHESLIAEARRVTAEHGIKLDLRIAGSDRETLFMFQRMAPDIDGFWLFPDNRILSVAILHEMLAYASRHQVEVAVFNAALLEMGASLSSMSVYSDVAATALSVASHIANGEADRIPFLTPLREIDIQSTSGGQPGIRLTSGSGSNAGRSP